MTTHDSRPRDTVAAELCEIGRRAWHRGYCAGNDGNYSVRIAPDRILCTPTGVSKGFMTPDMMCEVDLDGMPLREGAHRVTSEIKAHLAVYRARRDVVAVVHAHPPHAVAFCLTHTAIPAAACPEAFVLLGDVPLADYATPGTAAVGDAVTRVLKPDTQAMLLANHGSLTLGTSGGLIDAYYRLEVLDSICKSLLHARSLGELRLLTTDQLAALRPVAK